MLRCVVASTLTLSLTSALPAAVATTTKHVRTFSCFSPLIRTNLQCQGRFLRCTNQLKHRTFSLFTRGQRRPALPAPGPGTPAVPVRSFRTSRPHLVHPALLLLIKPVAKLASVFSGRALRRTYQQLPEAQKLIWQKRMKRALPYVIGAGVGLGTVNYVLHLQETPITKRRRYIAITPDKFLKIAQFEYEMQMENLQDKVVSTTHPYYKRIERVANRLIHANQDVDFLKKQHWTIILVDTPERNAFVLPTGHIFVYTGLMETVQNDDQLAVVMGHEMAHAILQHGAERLSFANFLDYFVIVVLGALWFFVPSDGIAIITHWFFNKVTHLLLNLPYDRKLETEADDVGLELIAKACYDVRESCNFWDLMRFLNETESSDTEVPEIFSTHPSNESRVIRLEEMIPKALGIRDTCMCPRLSDRDPRAVLKHMKAVIREAEEKDQEEQKAVQTVMAVT